MKSFIVKTLLAILNGSFLNNSPCRYGFINNIDAFDYTNLQYEVEMRPDVSVKEILEQADRFKSCPINKNGLTVIEPDGTMHEATVWDRHELNLILNPKTDEQQP